MAQKSAVSTNQLILFREAIAQNHKENTERDRVTKMKGNLSCSSWYTVTYVLLETGMLLSSVFAQETVPGSAPGPIAARYPLTFPIRSRLTQNLHCSTL
jgi:hypothetical protein